MLAQCEGELLEIIKQRCWLAVSTGWGASIPPRPAAASFGPWQPGNAHFSGPELLTWGPWLQKFMNTFYHKSVSSYKGLPENEFPPLRTLEDTGDGTCVPLCI